MVWKNLENLNDGQMRENSIWHLGKLRIMGKFRKQRKYRYIGITEKVCISWNVKNKRI